MRLLSRMEFSERTGVKERLEVILGPSLADRVDNLVQIQVDEAGGRTLRLDAIIGFCKEYACERHCKGYSRARRMSQQRPTAGEWIARWPNRKVRHPRPRKHAPRHRRGATPSRSDSLHQPRERQTFGLSFDQRTLGIRRPERVIAFDLR